MRHSTALLFAASLSVATTACFGDGTAAVSDAPAPTPIAASVEIPTDPSGTVEIRITLTDAESRTLAAVVEVAHDGTTFRPASITADAEFDNLPSSPTGVTTTARWDTLADLGFRDCPAARLRVRLEGADGAAATASAAVPLLDNLRCALEQVEHHMIHYGPFDESSIGLAVGHDLVVVHPKNGNVDVETIRAIQLGRDINDPRDDVLVLSYISVGEDSRTIGVSDSDMLLDARFVGDASGPRIDPRGPNADGQSLVGLAQLGLPTNSLTGTRYASWYLDDNSVDNSPTDVGDGIPDRNAAFGGCFVNAGDPAWFEVLDQMTFDGLDSRPGMRELLRSDTGRGFDCDGLFFDTFDTCAPNSYTDGSSPVQNEFEWTAPGFQAFTERFQERYPNKIALQNRGMFLFDPRLPHYQVTTRSFIDAVLVESYRLDSNPSAQFDAYFSADNKNNFAPKLLAEAGRPDGFRVFSLGYAEGPDINQATLLGQSSVGLQTLLEDIEEAQVLAGFSHYITDAGVILPNSFVRDRLPVDVAAPIWSSTYNDNVAPFPTPPGVPTPRPGIQTLTASDGELLVRWDVAQDQSRVGYALYLQTEPFDFDTDPTLAGATRQVLTPGIDADYVASGIGPTRYPFRATISGLTNATTYYACLRAFDALGNEERNEVVLSATPSEAAVIVDGQFGEWDGVPLLIADPDDSPVSAGPDWLDVAVTNDATNLYIRFTSAHPFNLDGSPTYTFSRTLIFLDLDGNGATGWPIAGIGSDALVAGDGLFTQNSSTFNTGSLGNIDIAPTTAIVQCEMAIPWALLDSVEPGVTDVRLVFLNDEVTDYAPDTGIVTYTATR